MTNDAAARQCLRDLARLRRVRDRIDREYAQPLNIDALSAAVATRPGETPVTDATPARER